MNTYDIIIIGGGVTGTSIARHLSRYAVTVALLEKEVELAFGVSKSNSGIIHPGTQISPHLLKGHLCVKGNTLIRRIARELGVDFKEVGELIVAFTDEEVATLRTIKKEGEALGVRKLKLVTPAWLHRHEPNLSKNVIAALYAPTAGIISPYRLAYDLSENAIRNGVAVHVQTCVDQIIPHTQTESPAHPRFEVLTTQGSFGAHYLVNAAGLHADVIARMVGITDFSITPRKGEEFLLDKKRHSLTNHLIFPVPTKNSKGTLVIKTADGNPMIGPTAVQGKDKEDNTTSYEGCQTVLSKATKLVPKIQETDIIAYFAGLRPVAGDDFIIRNEPNVPGMVTVAGIQSPGLTAAPAIAELVADLLKKGGLDLKKKKKFYQHRSRTIHLFDIPRAKTKKLVKKDFAYGDIVCRCEMFRHKKLETQSNEEPEPLTA